MTDLNIHQRINEVRKKIAYVQKDAEVQGYKAVTHDMVTAMVRDHLIEFGVLITPSLESQTVVEGQTRQGNPKIRYEAVFKVFFVNIDNPSDNFHISIPAHADDSGDKAPGKALSYATKAAILKVFNIETGVNDESRLEEGRRYTQLIEKMKGEVDFYLEHDDPLAVYLLQQSIEPEAWAEIFNSAPDGKKQAFKKSIRDAEATGSEMLKAINSAILTEDAGAAAENLEGLTEGAKRMLAGKLGPEKSRKLGELMKAVTGE